jgi:hypothetical protein
MLRVSADCDKVPPNVIGTVKTITSTAHHTVQAVCLTNDGMPFIIDKGFLLSAAMISLNICIKEIYC